MRGFVACGACKGERRCGRRGEFGERGGRSGRKRAEVGKEAQGRGELGPEGRMSESLGVGEGVTLAEIGEGSGKSGSRVTVGVGVWMREWSQRGRGPRGQERGVVLG